MLGADAELKAQIDMLLQRPEASMMIRGAHCARSAVINALALLNFSLHAMKPASCNPAARTRAAAG
jgi:hypothetical protein